MRTFVIGDIHGAQQALLQVLDRAGFDYAHDRLISLGDVADGWPETRQCVETLLSIKHLVAVAGNHDLWTRDWLLYGRSSSVWRVQGGEATMHSYRGCQGHDLERHRAFFANQLPYYEDDLGRLFVHGGYHPGVPIEEQSLDVLAWDRSLITAAAKHHLEGGELPELEYNEVYIGHTPINRISVENMPLKMGPVWAMDTGVKHGFPLSLMDVASKQCWQSDPMAHFYN